jgi:hypothetical protein
LCLCCMSIHVQSAKLFSSRRNWDSPNPSPAGECAPPPWFGGRGILAGERGGWESPNSDKGTYNVVLFINTYFVLYITSLTDIHRKTKDDFAPLSSFVPSLFYSIPSSLVFCLTSFPPPPLPFCYFVLYTSVIIMTGLQP